MKHFKKIEDVRLNLTSLLLSVKTFEPKDPRITIWSVKHFTILEQILKNSSIQLPPVKVVLVGRVQPGASSTIHTDQLIDEYPKQNNEVVFNIPLTPSNQVFMNWYSLKDESKFIPSVATYQNTKYVRKFEGDNAELIDCVDFTCPFYARTDVPHNLTNNTDSPAYAISFRFFEVPDLRLFSSNSV